MTQSKVTLGQAGREGGSQETESEAAGGTEASKLLLQRRNSLDNLGGSSPLSCCG